MPYQSQLQRQGWTFRLQTPDGEIRHVSILGAFVTGGSLTDGDHVVIERARETRDGDIRARVIFNARTRSRIRRWLWLPLVVPTLLVLTAWLAFMLFVLFKVQGS